MVQVMPLELGQKQTEPLSSEQHGRAERLAARLQEELRTIVDAFPVHARGASGMARHIGIVRNTCQRVVSVLQETTPNAETLVHLPGVRGLEQFLDGAESSGADPQIIELARAAVLDFGRFIKENAGSQSKLAERLASAARAGAGDASLCGLAARANLYQSAVHVTGRSCELAICIEAYRPCPGEDASIERAVVNGLIQTSVTSGGMPASILAGDTLDPEDDPQPDPVSLDNEPTRGATPSSILSAFSSAPLPLVTTRGSGSQLIQVIDPDQVQPGALFDIVTARRFVHPSANPDGSRALESVWSLVNCPAQRLLFDVYFHRDMERLFRPSIDAQLWNPNLESPAGARWLTRFPAQPKLQLLGVGLGSAASPFYPKHAQLTAHLFERMDWDPSEMVGFRCEVEFPVWRAGYCMNLDYIGDEPNPAG